MLRRVALALAIVAVAAAIPLFALAGHMDPRDPNDTRGPLDVRRVVAGRDLKRPRWKIVTFDPWRARQIFDRGYVLVFFDTFADKRYDYYALVRSVGPRLRGSLWRDRKVKSDVFKTALRVRRANRRSVTVRVPLGRMKFPETRVYYYWHVQTLMTNRRCPNVCFDRAPDTDGVLEPLPVATPSASPTPSSSPTP